MVKKPVKKAAAKSSKAAPAKGKSGKTASSAKSGKASSPAKKSGSAKKAVKKAVKPVKKAAAIKSKGKPAVAPKKKSVAKKVVAKPVAKKVAKKAEVKVKPPAAAKKAVKKTAPPKVVKTAVAKKEIQKPTPTPKEQPVKATKAAQVNKAVSIPSPPVDIPVEVEPSVETMTAETLKVKRAATAATEKKVEKKPKDLAKILKSKPLEGRNYIAEILAPVGNAAPDTDINATKEMQKEAIEPKKKSGDEKKGVTIEDKLRALYDLQLIDTRIDKIRAVRGELPLEVEDLENEVAGLTTRVQNYKEELDAVDKEIAGKKIGIKDAENMIKKYKEQQDKVRNNREFDSITKEVEYQELEIQLHKKKIKELEAVKATKTELIEVSETKMAERTNDLKVKKTELEAIISETQKEEKFLLQKSEEAQKVIEDRMLKSYRRIRESSRNGLAVVPIEREASAGSFITIPPQKQLDVAARKKIIIDEHSGRILVDADLAREETERIEGLLAQELKR